MRSIFSFISLLFFLFIIGLLITHSSFWRTLTVDKETGKNGIQAPIDAAQNAKNSIESKSFGQ